MNDVAKCLKCARSKRGIYYGEEPPSYIKNVTSPTTTQAFICNICQLKLLITASTPFVLLSVIALFLLWLFLGNLLYVFGIIHLKPMIDLFGLIPIYVVFILAIAFSHNYFSWLNLQDNVLFYNLGMLIGIALEFHIFKHNDATTFYLWFSLMSIICVIGFTKNVHNFVVVLKSKEAILRRFAWRINRKKSLNSGPCENCELISEGRNYSYGVSIVDMPEVKYGNYHVIQKTSYRTSGIENVFLCNKCVYSKLKKDLIQILSIFSFSVLIISGSYFSRQFFDINKLDLGIFGNITLAIIMLVIVVIAISSGLGLIGSAWEIYKISKYCDYTTIEDWARELHFPKVYEKYKKSSGDSDKYGIRIVSWNLKERKML